MKKKLEMHLLNDEQLNGVMGGLDNPCSKTGHILYKACPLPGYGDTIAVLCVTKEYKCGGGGFDPNFVYVLGSDHQITSGTCINGVKFVVSDKKS